MSHSLHLDGCTILFNSDGSGDATIHEAASGKEVEVPCTLLIMFAAHLARNAAIERLEQQSDKQILGL